jgi:meiotic recombination protein SPO11
MFRVVCDVKWLGLRFEDILLIPNESKQNLKERDKKIAKGLLASKMLQVNNSTRFKNLCLIA